MFQSKTRPWTKACCEGGLVILKSRLIDQDTCRADDRTAAEYNLEGGATLHLVLALRGGF